MPPMTHVCDLYEPGDDREPEPVEWYPAPEPVDLDAIEATVAAYYSGSDDDSGKAAEELAGLMGGVVAELREARRRIAEFEALPTRERWAVTAGPDKPPGPAAVGAASPELAEWGSNGKQMWLRKLTFHPWQPLDAEAPF